MTRKESRAILYAIGRWNPVGASGVLTSVDKQLLREQVADVLGPILGVEMEQAITLMDVGRMTDG